ncbi:MULTISPECIES: DUF47 family protein [unclassified Enterococcus]|uniref:DUF47 domain-containing protein n=1 Tax=unclassified Enterococcus TaxID=2608891 RepID=UPI0015522340|nr:MULTISPECIES: DUF47 family protein [unclassified Enterococcus]MBS7576658.1 DUF47 family protein [Enterococcus sp. MMGLQ5-2]MBS7583855.1 DUF47 family protein [Enterococcus sp. MMGLQ5-1]NPD11716.1 DUF47 family protein [Enterococcus sp. MMGLQ5-1]NPD36495.1 DUF47 family protein [Enterococcus sp. MMGLQ5-2]
MARKKQFNYFEAMNEISTQINQSSELLYQILTDYEYHQAIEKAEAIHQLERKADAIVAKIIDELAISFITPIDREDIVSLTNSLDDIIDNINEVTYLLENLVVKSLRPQTLEFSSLIKEATEGVCQATTEFPKFKNSKTLKKLIKNVNDIERKADLLYSGLTKEMYLTESNAIEIIKWRDLYNKFEAIVNQSERAVNTIGALVIKNS